MVRRKPVSRRLDRVSHAIDRGNGKWQMANWKPIPLGFPGGDFLVGRCLLIDDAADVLDVHRLITDMDFNLAAFRAAVGLDGNAIHRPIDGG